MKQKTIGEILKHEGYNSSKAFAEDAIYFVAMAKVEKYRAENELFEKRYSMKLEDFRESLKGMRCKEDFGREDDLQDWEFADVALKWWEEKIGELKGV